MSALIPKDAVLELLRSRLVRARIGPGGDPVAVGVAKELAEVLECVGVMVPVAAPVRSPRSPEPYSRD